MIPLQEKYVRFFERLKRDGWLFALLAAGILASLLFRASETSPSPSSGQETYFSSILSSMEGAGRVEVALSYQGDEESIPCGAVAVADGADDILVQIRLRRAISALTGLPDSRIEIFKREEDP